MFGKKPEKRPVGPSFPFMDGFEGSKIHFNKIVVEKEDDRLSFIFYQDSLPLYAQTYAIEVGDFTYTLDDIEGSIPFTIY